jgi:hypothetical protein
MAIAINGTGTVTGLTAGGLPDGSITSADLASSLDLTGKTVTLPSGTGGKVLQVQHSVKLGSQNFNTQTFTDITDLSVSITPATNSSKIVILYNVNIGAAANHFYALNLVRGSTNLFTGNGEQSTYPNNTYATFASVTSYHSEKVDSVAGTYVDTAHNSGGSAVTYKLQGATPHSSSYVFRVNRPWTTDNQAYIGVSSSSIIAMEVA